MGTEKRCRKATIAQGAFAGFVLVPPYIVLVYLIVLLSVGGASYAYGKASQIESEDAGRRTCTEITLDAYRDKR